MEEVLRPTEGRLRVVIENVQPEINGGRFPIKRVAGELVIVEGDVFADGHDLLSCRVLYRHESESEWKDEPMSPLGNDRWRATFRGHDARTIFLQNRGLGRPIPHLARRFGQENRSRPGRQTGVAHQAPALSRLPQPVLRETMQSVWREWARLLSGRSGRD